MKKTGLLNQPVSNIVAGLGHTQHLTIADAGLPIPPGPARIDLALTKGIPAFLDTLTAVLTEMQVEKAIVAEEMATVSPELLRQIQVMLPNVPLEMVSHEIFKKLTAASAAVIRTGEFTPYANIILVSGVVF